MPSYQIGKGQEVIFRDFAPDLDPTTPGIILDASNAMPTMKGYAARNTPVNVFINSLTALPVTPSGAYIALFSTGAVAIYAAGQGHIYQLQPGPGWVEVDGNVVYPATSPYQFTQFNDDVIVTANGLAAPLVATGINGTFVPLGGSPPANAVAVISVAGFVVFFAGPNWYSSAAGVDNQYVPDIQTLAATGTLYDIPGNVTAAASLYRSIIAFKAGATWVGTFSGAPFTWSFQLISGEVGTYGQGCVVTLPDSIAFLGTDDFYITTGYTPQRIPNSLKEWFFQTANLQQLSNVQGWYDPLNSVIYWHFVSNQTPVAGQLDRYVAFNVRVGRWSTGYLNANLVVQNTQNTQAALYGGQGSTSQGGYFFNPKNILYTWDSAGGVGTAPTTMYVKTGFLGDPDSLSQLLRFRAKWNVFPESNFATAFHTDILGKPPILDAMVVGTNDDWKSLRQYDRYHQVQFNSFGPAEIVGYAYEARQGGIR